jgi:peptidoglycan/LPS O-acetylase OafA/YrhL
MEIFRETGLKRRSITLDLLRIFACIWVLTYHWQGNSGEFDVKYPFGTFDWAGIDGFFSLGFLGVDIFFILSGCVIANTVLNRDPANFLAARFWRLFPSIAIVSFLTMIIRLLQADQSFSQQKSDIYQGLTNATGLPLLSAISGGEHVFWIPATWTLPIEILFYFIMATAILLFGRLDLKNLVSYATVATLLLFFLRHNLSESFAIYFLFGILTYCVTSWHSLLRLFPILVIATYLASIQLLNRTQASFNIEGYSKIITQIFCLGFILCLGIVLLLKDLVIIKSDSIRNSIQTLALMTFPFYLLHASFGLQLIRLLSRLSLGFRASCFVTLFGLIFLSWTIVKFFEPAFRTIGRRLVTKAFSRLN